jgi:hypothetical protein
MSQVETQKTKALVEATWRDRISDRCLEEACCTNAT